VRPQWQIHSRGQPDPPVAGRARSYRLPRRHIPGRMRVYVCTLVDDDPDNDLGDMLAGSLGIRVMLRHHRCYSCFRLGTSCSELGNAG